ncbi:hypothetical protein [Paractinoplanes durhamensis]|uniref:Uncharacterized protein n=1 Tax=Paractinoplanes durhamensis TaxID=113563 RepID=A0ABQ3Z1S5_9ACTN|nr:hypothetical protein [Actinoplanes durhamensis]GIE03768.1 hypothetical protein Adu01nite_51180 [Actinoplanes durhamensis]
MIDFELIIPEGWVHVPTMPGLSRLRERTIEAIVRHALPDTLPRDKAGPWRRMLRRELTDATDEAERQGARAVVLPVQELHGMRLPGTMLLSVLEDGEETQNPRSVLDSILADAGPDGMALELGGCPAARIRQIVESGPIKRKAPAVRISYFVAAPGAPGVWAVLTFTVLSDGDVDAAPVQAIVLLFDAVVATLRWADDVDVPTEDELLAQVPQ